MSTNFEIPMWSKPISITSSPRVAEVGNNLRDSHVASLDDFEIPLWAKPTTAINIGDYVSIVTLHQAEATRFVARQRAAVQCAVWEREVSSSASTFAEDSSDDGSIEDAKADVDDGRTGTVEFLAVVDASELVTSTIREPNTLKSLVAGLREARIRAQSRRMGLAVSSHCATEEFKTEAVCAPSCRSSQELIASVRCARHLAEACRMTPVSLHR